MEDTIITETRKRYKVEIHEDEITVVFVKKELVDKISLDSGEEISFVILILAYIEYVRKNQNEWDEKSPKKLQDEEMISGISTLVRLRPIEVVLETIKDLKWHEIVEIMQTENMEETIENKI